VICKHCGTEIADKALICYRCGTATTDATHKAPAPRRSPAARNLVIVLILLALAVMAALYLR